MNDYNYARIRSWGDKNHATTHDGDEVERQEYIFDDEYGLVKCAPMSLHFIYQDPRSHGKNAIKGRWGYMCTCGSMAGIVSYADMSELVSIESSGHMMVCIAGLASKKNTGIFMHADGSTE